MAKKEIITNFNFSFSELLEQSLEKQTYLERDQAELAPRGITPERLTAYAALLAAFQEISPDEVYKALLSAAVKKRDTTRKSLAIKLRDVAGVASIVLGDTSAEYRTFNYKKVSGSDAPEFLILAENIADRADDYIDQLSTNGITEEAILLIRTDIATFQQEIKDVATANGNRDIKTQERRTAANALYTDLSDMAEIAKVYYQDRDEAKYNDYIIYAHSETAQTRTGRLKAKQTKTRELEAINPETPIIIKNEGEAPLEAYFSQHTDGNPSPEGGEGIFATIPPHETLTLTAGENLGYNLEIDAVHFTLRNPSEDKEVIYRARIE